MNDPVVSTSAAFRRSWWLIAPLVVVHILPFVSHPALIGGDEPHYALAAYSIAVDHDLDLVNNYLQVAQGSNAAGRGFAGTELHPHISERHGRQVFIHPIGLPAMLAPLVWLQQRLAAGSAPDLLLGGATLTLTFFALLAGWSVVRKCTGDPDLSAFVVLCVYLSTPLWFYSRTFFTEPYIWAFAVLGLAGIAASRWLAAGIALGLAFLMKETAALIVIPVLLFALRRYRLREAALLAVGPGAAIVVFLVKNLVVYGAPLETFQAFEMGSVLSGAAGLIIDLEHGMLWFAPLLVVASAGWIVAPKARRFPTSVFVCSLIIVAGIYGLTALWIGWTGGACYGPRLLVPVMPLFAIPLIRLWREGSRSIRGAVVLAALFGMTVQVCAALDPFRAFWSVSIGELLLSDPWARLLGVASGSLLLWWLVPTEATVNPETG